jgi:Protein of unknown function (DUF3572)
MKLSPSLTQEAAEELAIQALTFIARDSERLGRFLAITGIGPAQIRAAAQEPGFLIGVLDHLAGDERLLSAFAAETGVDPAQIGKALAALGGHWERDIP